MVLVTGGSGFIGSHVVDALVERGVAVRILDRRKAAGREGVEAIMGDLRNRATAVAALRGVSAVSHQAAKVGLEASAADVTDYVAHNDVATATLLRAMAETGYRGRLVLASSMVVYGEGGYRCEQHGAVRPAPRRPAELRAGRFDPSCPSCGAALTPEAIAEDAETDPRNVYAATKLHQEHLCAIVGRAAGIAVTALRYHNVYGPGMPLRTRYAGVAARFADALRAGRAPRVTEDGRQLRDFVHVRDVARANVLALTAPEPVDGALNVCSGRPRTVAEIAGALHGAMGGPRPQVTGETRPGDVRHVFADASRAARRLGFRAREDFATGMAELAA